MRSKIVVFSVFSIIIVLIIAFAGFYEKELVNTKQSIYNSQTHNEESKFIPAADATATCSSTPTSSEKASTSEFSLVIPENAYVTMEIKEYTDGELKVTSNLIKKINTILIQADSNTWHNNDVNTDEGVAKLTIKYNGTESVLIFDGIFHNVTKGGGIWYELPEIADKFLIGKVSISGKYVYDSVSAIVIQQQKADIDQDGKLDDIRLTFNGKWLICINSSSYSLDASYLLQYANTYLNPNFHPGFDPNVRFVVVTLKDTKQPAVITYCKYRGRFCFI